MSLGTVNEKRKKPFVTLIFPLYKIFFWRLNVKGGLAAVPSFDKVVILIGLSNTVGYKNPLYVLNVLPDASFKWPVMVNVLSAFMVSTILTNFFPLIVSVAILYSG